MKLRFSALDVAAQATALAPRVTGMRLQNVYDVEGQRALLFKFTRSDERALLVAEPGVRLHATRFARPTTAQPSFFTTRLRKFLRTRRLTALRQLGLDRIVELKFGDGDTALFLYLELYAAGNVILTNASFVILAVLRVVELLAAATPNADTANSAERYAVGEVYNPNSRIRTAVPFNASQLRSLVDQAHHDTTTGSKPILLRKLLASQFGTQYVPTLIDHALLLTGSFSPATVATNDVLNTLSKNDSPQFIALVNAFQQVDELVSKCRDPSLPHNGFIYVVRDESTNKDTGKDLEDGSLLRTTDLLEEFHPIDFIQFQSPHNKKLTKVVFDDFDVAVDEFFTRIEQQRALRTERNKKLQAEKKLEAIKRGQHAKLSQLEQQKEQSELIAQTIEANLDLVDRLLVTIRDLLAQEMDWKLLMELVEKERAAGNPVAGIVRGFKLSVGMITIGLTPRSYDDDSSNSDSSNNSESENDDDPDEEYSRAKSDGSTSKNGDKKSQKKKKELVFDIDINVSAHANSTKFYKSKKLAVSNFAKADKAAVRVIKEAEAKVQGKQQTKKEAIEAMLSESQSLGAVRIRKPYWFEKYLWFITSENYLVVGGRDATQNETLVKKHLRDGDLYVHADIDGAASVIIKNNVNSQMDSTAKTNATHSFPEIPPLTIHQAGIMSICHSKAWESKIVTSAWHVEARQVSKISPTGDVLPPNRFMIRGKKKWCPPIQLIYGMAVLFKVDDDSVERHFADRRPWLRNASGMNETAQVFETLAEDNGPSKESNVEPSFDTGSLASQLAEKYKLQEVDSGLDGDEFAVKLFGKNSSALVGKANQTSAAASDAYLSVFGKLPDSDFQMDPLTSTPGHEVGEGSIAPSVMTSTTSKPRISAKQRRDMKKKGASNSSTGVVLSATTRMAEQKEEDSDDASSNDAKDAESADDDDNDDDEQDDVDGSVEPSLTSSARGSSVMTGNNKSIEKSQQTQQTQLPRGKRSKMKRAMAKYKDQDDEDKEAVMDFLQPDRGVQPKGKKAKALALKRAEEEKKALEAAQKGNRKQDSKQGIKKNSGSNTTDDRGQVEFRDTSHLHDESGHVGAFQSMDDGADNDDGDDDENAMKPGEDSSYLDHLVGNPTYEDTLLGAVVVCGPWTALEKYKYKAKLIPGSLKKGKAAQAVVSGWSKALFSVLSDNERPRSSSKNSVGDDSVAEAMKRELTKREGALMRNIPEVQIINAMIGKVKVVSVSGPGVNSTGTEKGGKVNKGSGKGRNK